MSAQEKLGNWLESTRHKKKAWLTLFIVILAVLAVLNFFIHPHHPHFGYDKYPEFWALFGFVVAVVMVFVMKLIVQPVIKRPEDWYDPK